MDWRPIDFWAAFFIPEIMEPTLSKFKEYSAGANLVPVYTELLADFTTPVATFAKAASKRGAFLLESAESIDNWGRYSFIGFEPAAVFTLKGSESRLEFAGGKAVVSAPGESPLEPLKKYIASRKICRMENLPEFFGGAVGYFSYETVSLFERLPAPKTESLWADASFGIYDDVIIFDNVRHTVKIVACARLDEFPTAEEAYADASKRVARLVDFYKAAPAQMPSAKASGPIKMKSEMPRADYCEMVEKAKEYIKCGEIIQAVLSQEFTADAKVDPVSAYRALRFINPSPYMFCLKIGDDSLVGSSPETLIRFAGGKAYVSPIAGTRKRGETPAKDIALADELLSNEKERAEHLMLVDLGRNDISRFCVPGSVQVGEFMTVQRYSHVMHLVSRISGDVKSGADAFDALAAAFPAGTLSGAPKVRAMQIINELEPSARGPYGGAVGYISYGGSMDMAITIRTLQIKNGVLSVRAGAGIVYDSDPEMEYEETRAKAMAVAKAIEAASKLELDTSSIL